MNETELIQLVTLAQTGDRDAFGKLVQQFEQTVFATVFRRLRNHAEAVEVTQDVFIQAMRKLPQLREPARFAGWLRRIAVRMSINRAVRRPNESSRSPEMFGSMTDNTETPLADLMKSEEAVQVRGGLEKLR
ncbi:MAG: sigma-70 family RNA polymerase sigma factor, partial [Planctomycetaceae bacterium]|nr:sigma-70 family RNA polymerase sigma factor [Planctomycetaceae bacterium]